MGQGGKRNNEEFFLNGLFKAAYSLLTFQGQISIGGAGRKMIALQKALSSCSLLTALRSGHCLENSFAFWSFCSCCLIPPAFAWTKSNTRRDSPFVVLPWVSLKNDLSINYQWSLFVCFFSSTAPPFLTEQQIYMKAKQTFFAVDVGKWAVAGKDQMRLNTSSWF